MRSSLAHAGTRAILWSAANGAQVIAETLFGTVLETADLTMKHNDFCNELAAVSYGSPGLQLSPCCLIGIVGKVGSLTVLRNPIDGLPFSKIDKI